jgi:hypothetical protein
MNQWIKFDKNNSKTWPKIYENVLVFTKLNLAKQQSREIKIAYRNNRDKFLDEEHCEEFLITHWMPLPEPPEEG